MEIDRVLAAADPQNLEAQQKLAYGSYVAGRIFQFQKKTEDAVKTTAKRLRFWND